MTSGYFNNPEENKGLLFILNENSTSKRFDRTGDISFIDEDGDLTYLGRIDN
ncbi:MAG: hypothetical protein ACYDA4_10885 [Ignavibacteriaceae bacterium]